MTAGCSAATPASGSSSSQLATPSTAAPLAHLRLGRRSRRSSSSGASSSSSTSSSAAPSGSLGLRARSHGRKRRRHSTLSSSGVASGSDDDERAPPTVRLRLGSYVSEFRIAGSRSSSPGTGRSTSPLLPRQRHQLSIHTMAPTPLSEAVGSAAADDDQDDGADADVDMDLEVQSTFQAMQVDSPIASPSLSSAASFFSRLDALPNAPPPNLVSGATAGVLAPLLIEPRYATPSRSPVQTNLALPSISALATATTVQPGMFPSASLIAARRNSRSSLGLQQHQPASPSPLSRMQPQQFANLNPFASHMYHHPHQHPAPSSQIPNRTRSSSTPPSPRSSQPDGAQRQMPPSPARRHSDGTPTHPLAS
ncbi:hypothetical protein PaG_01753 [Moesziomyces aphidis]|uniref:Uncharacterized protein n=1 Tax=Moesziomyces aphidis TaxID=84754 RepID=W3VP62_MOEAP|nr:hypothetical protein PaG_01753 [Moesziomyces aphidis]